MSLPMASEARFCLRCGTPLVPREVHGTVRPVCPRCGWMFFPDPKVAVAVLIQDHAGRVLLVQRRHPPAQGRWTLPAGFLNAHEDPREAAQRECREETGLEVTLGPLLDVLSGREHPKGADLLLVYRGYVKAGIPRGQDDAADARFFSLDALPPLAFRSTRTILERHARPRHAPGRGEVPML
ncbi:MAG: NUDIX domain-containing protein [Chloroflexi bacterium]|nr:NUDIX domain-containing protein [Chloroflexota bacterium]